MLALSSNNVWTLKNNNKDIFQTARQNSDIEVREKNQDLVSKSEACGSSVPESPGQ